VAKQYKILIVDDNPDILEITREELLACDYEVITASNGMEGLRKAERESPDLVILDIMLPGLDGYEVCHRLRSKPKTAELPILMYSAKIREADKETGLRMGADDYLTKSVDSSLDLVRRVEALLAKQAKKETEARADTPSETPQVAEVREEGSSRISAKPSLGDESVAEVEANEPPKAEPEADLSPPPSEEPAEPSDEEEEADMDDRRRSRLSPKPRL
jgi:DNA-binding response OmpR family regulator